MSRTRHKVKSVVTSGNPATNSVTQLSYARVLVVFAFVRAPRARSWSNCRSLDLDWTAAKHVPLLRTPQAGVEVCTLHSFSNLCIKLASMG